jgi:hypothetical protein
MEVMCAALGEFVEQLGRLPKQKEVFEHEGQSINLGRWLFSRKNNERDGRLDEGLKAAIEAAVGPQLAAGMWGFQGGTKRARELS